MQANSQTENQTTTNDGVQQSRPDGDKARPQCAMDYPAWVVVENPGQDNESIWSDHYMKATALRELKNCGGQDNGFDLMFRQPDGTLTTDF